MIARAAEIEASLAQEYGNAVQRDSTALRAIQDRFLSRLVLDPGDSQLTRAQRRRVLNPTFRDFRKAVELERELLGAASRHAPRRA